MLGFPIRTSSDQRSVGSSPRLIAASYVLHRPLMPRHPPCALKHLRHKKPIENKNQNCTSTPTDTYTHDRSRRRHILRALDARNHYPRIKHHTPPPKPVRQQQPPPRNRGVSHPHIRRGANGPVVSGPNSVSGNSSRPTLSSRPHVCRHMHPPDKPTTGAGDNPNHQVPHCCGDGGNPGSGHVNGAP